MISRRGFTRRGSSDDSGSRSSFPAEDNVKTERAQRRLRTPQAPGQRAGIFGPTGASPGKAVTGMTGADPQKFSGRADPRAPLGHHVAHAGRHRVGINYALDRGPA